MHFVQIIEVTTDRIEDLMRLEGEWRVAGRGRRTGTADRLCADRNPGRSFSVNQERVVSTIAEGRGGGGRVGGDDALRGV